MKTIYFFFAEHPIFVKQIRDEKYYKEYFTQTQEGICEAFFKSDKNSVAYFPKDALLYIKKGQKYLPVKKRKFILKKYRWLPCNYVSKLPVAQKRSIQLMFKDYGRGILGYSPYVLSQQPTTKVVDLQMRY